MTQILWSLYGRAGPPYFPRSDHARLYHCRFVERLPRTQPSRSTISHQSRWLAFIRATVELSATRTELGVRGAARTIVRVARDQEQSGQSTSTRARTKPPGGGRYARITVGSQVNTILWATGVPVTGSQKSCSPAQAPQAGRWLSYEPAANLRVSQDGLTPGGQVSSFRLAEPAISNVP